jgi:hypothetical protein
MASVTLTTGITAYAGGGLENATQLTKEFNNITVCATDLDSVKLPAATTGLPCEVYNSTSKNLAIYPQSTPIDGGDEADYFVLKPGQRVKFIAISTTSWLSDNPQTKLVTQASSITTGVTLNALKGIITTVAATAGAAGATPNVFTVTNNLVRAGANVRVNILDYAGTHATNGTPQVQVDNVVDGAFDINISNSHGTNALNGVLKISFVLLN